jgi:hypothetical protein
MSSTTLAGHAGETGHDPFSVLTVNDLAILVAGLLALVVVLVASLIFLVRRVSQLKRRIAALEGTRPRSESPPTGRNPQIPSR